MGALGSLALGTYMPQFTFKKNPFDGGLSYILLAFFNVVLLTGVIVEVLALLVLYDIFPSTLEQAAVAAWALPFLLNILLVLVVIERRVNMPAPTMRRSVVTAVLIIAGASAVFSLNAFFVEVTPFLFVTDIWLFSGHAVYLVLVSSVLQAVAVMVLFKVPTLFELLFHRQEQKTRVVALTSASPIVFTLIFTGLVLGATMFVAAYADKISITRGIFPRSAGLRVLLAFPATLLVFFVTAGILTWRRDHRQYRLRMDRAAKILLGLQLGSAAVTFGFLYVSWRLLSGEPFALAGYEFAPTLANEAIVLTLLAATGPVGFYLHRQQTRYHLLEERLSDFLLDVAETSKSGLPLHQSLAVAATKDYGPLGPAVTRMSHQVAWGLGFADAFRRFGEGGRTKLIRRSANLVVESSRSGGNVSEVLTSAARDIYEMKSLEEDRRMSMTTYVIVIYLVFSVFMSVLAVLSHVFLPQLLETTKAAEASGVSGVFGGAGIDIGEVRNAYFYALLVQGVGNGVVCGMIRDGNLASGLRHVFFMVVMAYAAFRFIM